MTLNSETGEKEWQLPVEKQIYEHNGEMYVIEVGGKDGEVKELVVSPEHKVYIGYQNNPENSDLLKTFISDCFFNSLSSEIIKAFNSSANATKSTSFRCFGIKDTALGICLEYFENGINLTTFFNLNLSSSNSSRERFDFLSISDLCLSNSLMANSGEYTSCPDDNNFLINEPFQKNEYNLFVSNTSFIYNMPLDLSSFNLSCLTFSPNSSASCSVNLDLETISSAIPNSKLLTNCLTTLANADSKASFSSGDISTLIQISSIDNYDNEDYLNLSVDDFSLKKITDVYNNLDKINKENKQLIFLDEWGNKIKIKSITKKDYDGKIYDVNG